MTRVVSKKSISSKAKPVVLGARAFAAMSAVEGLKLGKESRERLVALKKDRSLSPDQRRAEVLRAYTGASRKG